MGLARDSIAAPMAWAPARLIVHARSGRPSDHLDSSTAPHHMGGRARVRGPLECGALGAWGSGTGLGGRLGPLPMGSLLPRSEPRSLAVEWGRPPFGAFLARSPPITALECGLGAGPFDVPQRSAPPPTTASSARRGWEGGRARARPGARSASFESDADRSSSPCFPTTAVVRLCEPLPILRCAARMDPGRQGTGRSRR